MTIKWKLSSRARLQVERYRRGDRGEGIEEGHARHVAVSFSHDPFIMKITAEAILGAKLRVTKVSYL